ncbi:MAG: hypothetical protein II414_03940, partial [Erysipelotrichaceae bacterium]|nr:hypothetical protein [Erysipelotrichaceae bacterium]
MNKKRKLSLALAVLLSLSMLSGCNKETPVEPAEENETVEPAEQQEEPAKPEYDNSQQYTAVVLQDGDSITGGTYTATGTDE